MDEEIDFVIGTDGEVKVSMIGYKGPACEAEMKKIIQKLGVAVKTKKKPEYYEENHVNVNQKS